MILLGLESGRRGDLAIAPSQSRIFQSSGLFRVKAVLTRRADFCPGSALAGF